jgi:hypothetical protein
MQIANKNFFIEKSIIIKYLKMMICFKRLQSYKEIPEMQSGYCKILLKRLRFSFV